MSIRTVPLLKKNLFISRSCPILVLKAVLGRPRHADAKNSGKNYQGQLRHDKMRFENTKYLNFPHTFF